MQNRPALPEFRSPKTIVHEWRREAAHIEVAVALALMLSIFALLFAIARDNPIVVTAISAFA